jgi:tRNA(fMet)-specific endonuclease VapC
METESMILCDTNIIIELYKNNTTIINELQKIGQDNIAINCITAGELIYGALNKKELNRIVTDISNLNLIQINTEISNYSIELMKGYSLSHKLNLPDSIIASTAIINKLKLFTLNLKDFKYIDNLDLYKFSKK